MKPFLRRNILRGSQIWVRTLLLGSWPIFCLNLTAAVESGSLLTQEGTAWVGLAASSSVSLRPAVQKLLRTVVDGRYEPNTITVKFRDGLNIRLRGDKLVSTNAALFVASQTLFDQLAQGRWQRADALPEDKIKAMRQQAQAKLGRALPDLNLQFYLELPPGLSAAWAIESLNALEMVELAQPVPRPVPQPLPPDYEPTQTNLTAGPAGIDAVDAWTTYNDLGQGIKVADLEYSFNSFHWDLPPVVTLSGGYATYDPFTNVNHGTAVMGELGALRNGWGTTGISPSAQFYFVPTCFADGWRVDRAISTALGALQAGDVLVIEQQIQGPNFTNSSSQFGLVPVEWYKPIYDRVVTAVGLGVIVCEAAGNGSQNLDDPVYSTGNSGHWPFLAANNSGAIIVGAGAAWNGSSTARSRLSFSNYGSRLDLQGWGEQVRTTGYGTLYSAPAEGSNTYYTATFGGTSSATPMAAGACVLLQSAYKNVNGSVLSPSQLRSVLTNTGSPQQSGAYPASQTIGPLPNLAAALARAVPPTNTLTINLVISNVVHRFVPPQTFPIPRPGAVNDELIFERAGLANTDLSRYSTFELRLFAPPGTELNINSPTNYSSSVYIYFVAGGDTGSRSETTTLTFENFSGVAPVRTYTFCSVFDAGNVLAFHATESYSNAIQFTAMKYAFTPLYNPTNTSKNFTNVSYASPPVCFVYPTTVTNDPGPFVMLTNFTQPALTPAPSPGGGLSLSWPTRLGVRYQPQFTTNLSLGSGGWSDLGAEIAGTGLPTAVTNTMSGPMTFYRLRILP